MFGEWLIDQLQPESGQKVPQQLISDAVAEDDVRIEAPLHWRR